MVDIMTIVQIIVNWIGEKLQLIVLSDWLWFW